MSTQKLIQIEKANSFQEIKRNKSYTKPPKMKKFSSIVPGKPLLVIGGGILQ
jgi:hypothetical protein